MWFFKMLYERVYVRFISMFKPNEPTPLATILPTIPITSVETDELQTV
jgi:hypothetical protein